MADKKIELRIIAPDKASNRNPYKLHGEYDMVIIRCSTGDMGFLPGRACCSMVLDSGVMRMFSDGSEERMVIHGGIGHLQDDVITLLADGAQRPEEIDADKVSGEIESLQGQIERTSDLGERDLLKRELKRCMIQLAEAGKE